MTDVDSSHYNEEKLSELFDTVWTGYGADTLNPTSGPSRSRRSNRPLPPTPGSATSSPVSARPYGLDSPDGSTPSSRQLPFRPTTHFTQSPTEEAAPHSPFPPPPPPPIVNRAYVEDTPAYSPPYPGYNHSFPSDEKTPAFIPPPPPPPVQWSSPGASSSGLGVSSSSSRYQYSENGYDTGYEAVPSNTAGPSSLPYPPVRNNSDLLHAISAGPSNFREEANFEEMLQHHGSEDGGENFWGGSDVSEDESRFVNHSLLSHLAVQLKDKVPRGTHVKGSIPYPRAFTGKDIVSTIQSLIQRELLVNHDISTTDRRAAVQVARSLQSQLFFYEVEWGGEALQDGVEDVYMFWDDQDGPSGGEPAELPTGVITVLTRCYTPDCVDGAPCYSPRCPRRGDSILGPTPTVPEPVQSAKEDWIEAVPKEVLASLPESEINRQTIIQKLISKEEQYIEDLDIIESVFIRPLRQANPPIISGAPGSPTRNSYPSLHATTPNADSPLDAFIDTVFSNILDLRECNKRLLEVLYVRQREQSPVIQKIGDIFLDAATEFRMAYPIYVGGFVAAEKRLREEAENNVQWRLFVEQSTREVQRHRKVSTPNGNDLPTTPNQPTTNFRLDLKHYLNRPIEHLQKYPVLLEAILNETADGNPDADFLVEAIEAIKALQGVAQMRTFQTSMGRGPAGKWEWFDMINGGKGGDMTSKAKELGISKMECKRQSIIFELIKGEMTYVRDLENISVIYLRPLRNADPPIIPPDRLEQFISDVFHNYGELFNHHRRLLEKFQEIQRDEHPIIRSITAAVFDAALNFREAYLEYITHYPISEYKIDEEIARNLVFKKFVEDCVRHPEANRLDMKNFVNRPIPRLLRYELLLKNIMDETIPGHEDHQDIPQVLEVIKALGKDSEPGVVSAKQKVELWRYNSNIVFKPGEWIDMDLLNENRSLIHTGKLLRQPEGGLNGWSELFVLLFDNYFVMTKCREKDGITKYYVNRRPIPLDLLALVNFTDPPTQRGAGLLRNLRGERHNTATSDPSSNLLRANENGASTLNIAAAGMTNPSSTSVPTPTDSRSVFPCTIHHNGRMGGAYILYAESQQARMEWRTKLEEAMGLRKVVQESNKVFEIETLSSDTFLVPPVIGANPPDGATWSDQFTGKVTCSVPFNTPDGRGLVAIGCAEGVWIGFRHDSRSMRRVLHLKMVSQCAMLEDFGIFLVLADKSLFAYHIEALVPSSPSSQHASQTPQKLSGNKDVHFFSVGTLQGRTLVIYMKKKSMDSIFYAVEPVIGKIKEVSKAPAGLGSRFGFRTPKSDWFRPFREFFLPSESYDLIFLKARIAILCSKGFEIMDLSDLQSVTIPQREDPRLSSLIKRCEACKPLGMFRSTDEEFLLCYNEFGLYVNKRGEPSRQNGLIEWEGTAERVALHSPYILLFDIRFIEIRHVQTGRLAQIINGHDVHCLWDGRGAKVAATINSIPGQEDDDRMVQEPRVHGVMNAAESRVGFQNGRNTSKAIAQHVFELIPTIPLYLPGSLASPSTPAYFPQSYSPPHSPTLRPVGYRV